MCLEVQLNEAPYKDIWVQSEWLNKYKIIM